MLRAHLFLVLSSLAACSEPVDEPGGNDLLAPGVAGILALALDVPLHDFKTLELRAFPRFATTADWELPAGTFDPAYAPAIYLSTLEFPYAYRVGASWLGTSDTQGWRVLAWLSTAAFAETVAPGDWYGYADFELHDCSAYCDAACYCSLTQDVGFTIATRVP
jgi:hypothetical protein